MFANEWQARKDICEVGRRLYDKGFAAANDGNISVRLAPDRILCTPTGVSKGYLKPDDLGIVDLEGKQISGTKKRTSEILLHLSVYKARPDIGGVLHCHPPHATAFAMVHESIPKCVLPEVEVFLGEVPIARYETPGTQIFADTVLPYVHNCNTMLLANHGSVAFSKEIMTAYFNTEIIDAYCRMLILAKQLGPLKYLSEGQVGELLQFKKRLGIDDPRLHMEDCDLCGNSLFREGYDEFSTESKAFVPPFSNNTCAGKPGDKQKKAAAPAPAAAESPDMEALVQTITAQVLAALGQK